MSLVLVGSYHFGRVNIMRMTLAVFAAVPAVPSTLCL